METGTTKVTAIRCAKCGDTIYSRAHHDFHYCSCGAIAIDGGFDYFRCTYKGKKLPKAFEMDVPATKKMLYDDWNKNIDRFGVIRQKEKSTASAVKFNDMFVPKD